MKGKAKVILITLMLVSIFSMDVSVNARIIAPPIFSHARIIAPPIFSHARIIAPPIFSHAGTKEGVSAAGTPYVNEGEESGSISVTTAQADFYVPVTLPRVDCDYPCHSNGEVAIGNDTYQDFDPNNFVGLMWYKVNSNSNLLLLYDVDGGYNSNFVCVVQCIGTFSNQFQINIYPDSSGYVGSGRVQYNTQTSRWELSWLQPSSNTWTLLGYIYPQYMKNINNGIGRNWGEAAFQDGSYVGMGNNRFPEGQATATPTTCVQCL